MDNIFKKIVSRSVSLLLVLILSVNNIWAMEPQIDENALIAKFRADYIRKTSGSSSATGFCPNPSDKFTQHDVPSLYYEQKGGTCKGEARDVYVWNLPGVVDTESFGICTILFNCLDQASKRLDSGSAVKLIERGKKLKDSAIGTAAGGLSANIIKEGAEIFGVTQETLIRGFQRSMTVFGFKNPEQMAGVFNKCLSKVSSNGVLSGVAPYAPYVLSAVLSALGVWCTLRGCAKINEDARNIADAETIIDTFLMLIASRKYLGSNVVVMAKDNTSIPWYDAFRRGATPFISFWKHRGLAQNNWAPIFEPTWPSLDTPAWAFVFITDMEDTVTRLTNPNAPASVRKALEDAQKRLAAAEEKAMAALPGGSSRKAIEGPKK